MQSSLHASHLSAACRIFSSGITSPNATIVNVLNVNANAKTVCSSTHFIAHIMMTMMVVVMVVVQVLVL